ncbi:hypothetical protein immuto35A_144 [Flavobacterium phage vB_FspM_immuto_3-5A]|uniref:Uncharacterized protein n=1 Tax=Flavobacterium phage vB_FspM_immuto_2-6A TaxID=2801477 RepID=A0A7T8ERF3_9CAUD|nr:hypothetical protein KNV73_gp126 [Flavobacterium phage vB_FspM_immuto_2-6A]QQO91824.1 hypothetical protein immuto26A_145 [Flavobacterium phage vB_FspM_immuto_2-6A]QQO92062.1 hypothetical protein immuto35A_144 [Flavobacterium phage vB_FspM_immuto_3-5A]QQO92300.1 hypothetical protein immuto136C_144 [Flavobacterium phage vB_FspM_immuto_13-6C]
MFLIFNIEPFGQFSNYPQFFFRKIFHYRSSIYLYKMKKLNSDDLFNIFSIGDEEIYKEHNIEDMMDNTFILFGMVVRGVENYFIIDKMYASRYQERYDSVRENIKLKYFNGLVNYLERIKVLQSDTVMDIEDEFGLQAIKYALEEMLEFYKELEMYEKCAIIFKYYQLFLKE